MDRPVVAPGAVVDGPGPGAVVDGPRSGTVVEAQRWWMARTGGRRWMAQRWWMAQCRGVEDGPARRTDPDLEDVSTSDGSEVDPSLRAEQILAAADAGACSCRGGGGCGAGGAKGTRLQEKA